MIHRRLITFLLPAAVPLVALAAIAVGSTGGGGASASPTPSKATAGQLATLGVANSGLGRILVDSQGRTLYLFQKDSGTTSTCFGACAAAWPPLRVTGLPTGVRGADTTLLGTTARSDGGTQVTYNGHPLYLFIKDHKPGDTTGEGKNAFGGNWFALSARGSQISAPAPTDTPTNSGGGGY